MSGLDLKKIREEIEGLLSEGVKILALEPVTEDDFSDVQILETRTQDILDGKKTNWKLQVKIAGVWYQLLVSANKIEKLRIFHPSFYAVHYGLDYRGNYDLPSIHEVGGGGVVAQPYFLTEDGRLFIGWIKQRRDFMTANPDEPVLNAVRGFSNYQHLAQAMVELGEETGVENIKLIETPGHPINFNSARVETWGQVKDHEGNLAPEGLKFFAAEISPSSVIKNQDEDSYLIKPEFITAKLDKKEGILSDLISSPYTEAIKSGDQFTVIGAARILLLLAKEGISVKII